MAVGLKEVAQAANVSMMTVSRVMRNAPGVHAETRDRIQTVAREMGYVPNRVASNLVSKRTQTVGIVVPNIERFFPQVVMAVEECLDPEGYQQFLCCSRHSVRKEYELVSALISRRVDGLILAPVSSRSSDAAVALAQTQEIPIVLIDRLVSGVEIDSVVANDFEGAHEAVAAMIASGCRKLVHLAGPPDNWAANERSRGFQAALMEAGLPCPADSIVRLDTSVESGRHAIARLLDRDVVPDGVFCFNDLIAAGAYSVLREEGIVVPDTIRMSCLGAVIDADIFLAPVRMAVQDTALLGRKAAELLLLRIGEPNFRVRRPEHLVLPVRLMPE